MAVSRVFQGPFTVDDYYRLAECGILHGDSRVELIDGQVVPMNPIGPLHGSRVAWLTQVLVGLLGKECVVSVQNPVRLGNRSEPQPDVMVVRARADFYRHAHPTAPDVLLLIEVADSTVDYDREIKIPLYARMGIPEVWLVDLPGDAIEIYREPSKDGYRDVRVCGRGDTVTPRHMSGVALAVSDVLG